MRISFRGSLTKPAEPGAFVLISDLVARFLTPGRPIRNISPSDDEKIS